MNRTRQVKARIALKEVGASDSVRMQSVDMKADDQRLIQTVATEKSK